MSNLKTEPRLWEPDELAIQIIEDLPTASWQRLSDLVMSSLPEEDRVIVGRLSKQEFQALLRGESYTGSRFALDKTRIRWFLQQLWSDLAQDPFILVDSLEVDCEEIADVLNRAKELMNWSGRTLGLALGVNSTTVGDWITGEGKRNATQEFLCKIRELAVLVDAKDCEALEAQLEEAKARKGKRIEHQRDSNKTIVQLITETLFEEFDTLVWSRLVELTVKSGFDAIRLNGSDAGYNLRRFIEGTAYQGQKYAQARRQLAGTLEGILAQARRDPRNLVDRFKVDNKTLEALQWILEQDGWDVKKLAQSIGVTENVLYHIQNDESYSVTIEVYEAIQELKTQLDGEKRQRLIVESDRARAGLQFLVHDALMETLSDGVGPRTIGFSEGDGEAQLKLVPQIETGVNVWGMIQVPELPNLEECEPSIPIDVAANPLGEIALRISQYVDLALASMGGHAPYDATHLTMTGSIVSRGDGAAFGGQVERAGICVEWTVALPEGTAYTTKPKTLPLQS